MVVKRASAVYLSKELHDFLQTLEPEHKFNKWVEDLANILKDNMLAGDSVPKRQIPRYYHEKFGVNNLYRFEHPE
jgi:hypothetical protein